MTDLSNITINQLRCDARNIVRELGLLNDSYFEIDVTVAERHLLIELALLQEPTMGEIAKRLLLNKSTISRLIARAHRKGYVKIIINNKDKRSRFVTITKKGIEVLNTFEPIAFEQTKKALLTLKPYEIQTVYQGLACYAKGLRSSRLQENDAPLALPRDYKIASLQVTLQQLDQLGYCLDQYDQSHQAGLYKIFQQVVDTGMQFPYESSSLQNFNAEFIRNPESVYVCHAQGRVVGGFYIRANYSGRCSHIANAAYMVIDSYRGQGIGALMLNASLHFAQKLGFQAMQFNMVLSQNVSAVKFYEKFGFNVVGTIPNAIRKPDGNYQDGLIMYRELKDLQ